MAALCPCGEPKKPGPGQKYCALCADLRLPLLRQEAYAKAHAARLVAQPLTLAERREHDYRAFHRGNGWCMDCQQELPRRQFSVSEAKKGASARCKPCASDRSHERSMLKQFGITPEQYRALLEYQGGVCWICERAPQSTRLAVDHDHGTGLVRGLLCSRCNDGILGHARDVGVLQRAVAYMEEPPAQRLFGIETPVGAVGNRGVRAARAAASTGFRRR